MSYWRESVKGEDVVAEYLVQAIFHTSSTVHRSFARTHALPLVKSWGDGSERGVSGGVFFPGFSLFLFLR